MKLRNQFTVVVVYLAVIISTIGIAALRGQVRGAQITLPAVANPQPSPAVNPRFSLSTSRTYGSDEKARVYIAYQGVTSLDFRVYRVEDPFRFFRQLKSPHQLGEEDKAEVAEVAATVERKPTILEKLRSFKSSVTRRVKNYFRGQLRRESRTAFNDKFRAGQQLPLNEADYARVPLLNSDQVTIKGAWKQILTATESEYDTRMIPLNKLEQGVYLVEAMNGDLRAYTIIVVTDLTTINKTTRDGQMFLYAVDRKSGEPRADVQIEVVKGRRLVAAGKTNGDGMLRVSVRKDQSGRREDEAAALQSVGNNSYLVLGRRGDQFAVSDLQPYYFGDFEGEGDGEFVSSDKVASYIYTDRPVYRPEQKVYFKGIVRRLGEGGYETPNARVASVRITDTSNNELFNRELPLSSRGTFSGEVDLPAGAALGYYSIVASFDGAQTRGSFEVAEYKKPEFKVKVSTPKKFAPIGEKAKFTVEAKYFFGEPVAGGDVQYYIYRSRYYHWWFSDEDDDGLGGSESDDEEGYHGYGNDMLKQGQGRLDSQGRLEVTFDVPPIDESNPYDFTYRLEAQVTDRSRRMEEGKSSFVGTRGNVVVFARPEKYVYYQDDSARIKIKTADYEGRPVSSKVGITFVEVKYQKEEKRYSDGSSYYAYTPVYRDLSSAEVTTNSQGEATYDYNIPITGSIRIKTSVDDKGKRIPSDAGYIYAADRNNRWADWAYQDYGSIKLIPDKKSYKPGETAHVLAMLPTDKAHLLVTTEMSSVMDAWKVEAASRAVMIDVKIEEKFSPNVYLSVAYVKNGEMFQSDKSLNVPARSKFLNLEIIPDKKEYKPGEAASYTVAARNADGTPAAGVELSLGVVDEAIYSVRTDTSGDIRRAFYGTRYNRVETSFSTAYEFTGYSGARRLELASKKRPYQLADFKSEDQLVEPKVRKNFKDTAFWKPDVVTGEDGKVAVKFDMPENLTTWRATARAVSADLRVGSFVSRVLSRKNLILRLETPRFMTEGDVVTVSGIVHNYLDSDKAAQVKLEVGGVNLLDADQHTVTITKQGEQRIDWRISSSQLGEATLRAYAKTNEESDAIELKLPVIPQGLKRTTGGAAAMVEETSERTFMLDLPANANLATRRLRIEASPSIAGALFGALDYLTGYPYGCVEQTMSSFLPNVIVAQTLKDVKTASIKSSNDLNAKVQRGLERLYGFQHTDGGWGWWQLDQTDPFMTAYVVDGLALARRAGYAVEDYRLNRGRDSVKRQLNSGKLENGKPIDLESRAYLVYALTVSADSPNAAEALYFNDLFAKRAELQPYGRALLALTLKHRGDDNRARQVLSELESKAGVTDFDAHWQSTSRPMLDFSEENDLEATALAVKALARINPQSALLPKAARWLVANRRNGYYWESTRHTAFAIFALSDYLKVSRELSADYTLEVSLNGKQLLSSRVTAAEAAAGKPILIELKGDQVGVSNQARVVKRGVGALYASATLDYYTREETTASQSSKDLSLEREYLRLRVSEAGGKPTWIVEPLSGELRSGDLIVARLRLRGARARYLMIEDPIPAGCEQLERASGVNLDYSDGRWSDWYNNREFRDQRTVIFADYFDGDATFQYAMRVIAPGDFKVAPARAELMYQPTVQANTANLKLNILDRNK